MRTRRYEGLRKVTSHKSQRRKTSGRTRSCCHCEPQVPGRRTSVTENDLWAEGELIVTSEVRKVTKDKNAMTMQGQLVVEEYDVARVLFTFSSLTRK